MDIPPGAGGSLRSRIGDKEAPRSLPQAPSSYRPDSVNDRNGEPSGRDDDRDGSRKRTISGELITSASLADRSLLGPEREKDIGDTMGTAAEQTQPSKRPRIRRDRTLPSACRNMGKLGRSERK